MSKEIQSKPLSAYKELQEPGRRLVNKLIIGLHDQQLDEGVRLDINRCINRARRDPNDTEKRNTNGYLMFYMERFTELKKNENDKPVKVTEIAKQLGKEWKGLTDDEKAVYNKQAAELR